MELQEWHVWLAFTVGAIIGSSFLVTWLRRVVLRRDIRELVHKDGALSCKDLPRRLNVDKAECDAAIAYLQKKKQIFVDEGFVSRV